MQVIEQLLEHAAQVIRPVQVDHHLEPDALRGSEHFLSGPLAAKDGDGKPVPILNAEAARIDMLRSQQMSGQTLTARPAGPGEVLGHALPEEALKSTTGDGPKRSVETFPVATDANGKPLMLPGQQAGEPAWMAQARAAGWLPNEEPWMQQARRAGWTTAGSGPVAPGSTAEPVAGATPPAPTQNLAGLRPDGSVPDAPPAESSAPERATTPA